MTNIPMLAPAQEFDISGGNLALDFANTVSKRRSGMPEEHLHSCFDLIRWATQAGAISSTEANRIFDWVKKHPKAATKLLQRTIEIRETFYRIFSATATHQKPTRDDLGALSLALQNFYNQAELKWTGNGVVWAWIDKDDSLEKILWQVMRACVDLLMSDEAKRVRECEAETCAWLFMDHSKNQSRRWCDMQVCGNREKAKRFYKRNH
ncbi:MAG TPA: ABATE domain-containing protein [Terriglobales bacterium]|nr:ABATE domain-containing protein [Terriglobales bacterium]